MEVRSFIGVGLDDVKIAEILSHNSISFEEDRYPSHVILVGPDETAALTSGYGVDLVQRSIKRTWDGINGTMVDPIGFRTFGPLGEVDGNSHLTLLLDWEYQTGLAQASRRSLLLDGDISPLPPHATVCKNWYRDTEGLVLPIGKKIGITGVFLYSKDSDGIRLEEQIV